MAVAQFDSAKEATDAFVKIFQRRTWLLGVPNAAGTWVVAAFAFIAVVTTWLSVAISIWTTVTTLGPGATPNISPAQVTLLAGALVFFVLLTLVVGAYTYGWSLVAAEPCWAGQDPALGSGAKVAWFKLLSLIGYTLIVLVLGIVSLLVIVGPIVIAVLATYGPCYIVFKNRTATEALADSFRLASQNIGPTVILAVFVGSAYLVGLAVTLLLGAFLGPLATTAFVWLFGAYSALAVVRFFQLLTTTKVQSPYVAATQTQAN